MKALMEKEGEKEKTPFSRQDQPVTQVNLPTFHLIVGTFSVNAAGASQLTVNNILYNIIS